MTMMTMMTMMMTAYLFNTNPLKLGEVRNTNNCGPLKVIKLNGCKVEVEFEETGFRTTTIWQWVIAGSVKDPYARTVFEEGYLGEGKFHRNTNEYELWKAMLQRVHTRSSYEEVRVSERWTCLQNFGDDINRMINYNVPDFQLDKDILFPYNKVYSRTKCCFIPREVNAALTSISTDKKSGVYVTRSGKWEVKLYEFGKLTNRKIFSDRDIAIEFRLKRKADYLKRLAKKYKEDLPRLGYENLKSGVFLPF